MRKQGGTGEQELISADVAGVWNAAWGSLWFSDLGLYYVHGRCYSPDVGHFIEPNERGKYLYGPGDEAVNWAWTKTIVASRKATVRRDLWSSPFVRLVVAAILPCATSVLCMFVCFGLLADADRRNIELFHKQGTFRLEPAAIQSVGAWREADFMGAARVLLESAGDKPYVSSGFNEVSFSTPCTNTQDGPQEMTFSYSNKAPSTRSGKAYEQGYITVYRSGRIEWIESVMADVHQDRTALKRGGQRIQLTLLWRLLSE